MRETGPDEFEAFGELLPVPQACAESPFIPPEAVACSDAFEDEFSSLTLDEASTLEDASSAGSLELSLERDLFVSICNVAQIVIPIAASFVFQDVELRASACECNQEVGVGALEIKSIGLLQAVSECAVFLFPSSCLAASYRPQRQRS